MNKIFLLIVVVLSCLLFSACGVTINTGDEKEEPKKEAPSNGETPNTEAPNTEAPSKSEDKPALTTPYEGKIATELFHDEVMPRFVDKKLLDENNLSYGCAPEGNAQVDENYSPLEIEDRDQKYNCYVEYLGRGSTQKFLITFKSDGNYTTQSKGDSITDYEDAY